MCPACGYNLETDKPLQVGDWLLDPRGEIRWKGQVIGHRPSWANILLTLAREQGRRVTTEVLTNRTTSTEDTNVVAVQLSLLRKKLTTLGIPIPWQSYWGRSGGGYSWIENND